MTDRRSVVQGSGLLGVLLGSQLASPSLAGQAELEGISQPAAPAAKSFMERAFEMRRLAVEKRDCGYGAVIVRNNVIVGQSWSRVILDHDPTAHAEVAAIRDAARRLQERNLNGMVMYSSSRPDVRGGSLLGGH